MAVEQVRAEGIAKLSLKGRGLRSEGLAMDHGLLQLLNGDLELLVEVLER